MQAQPHSPIEPKARLGRIHHDETFGPQVLHGNLFLRRQRIVPVHENAVVVPGNDGSGQLLLVHLRKMHQNSTVQFPFLNLIEGGGFTGVSEIDFHIRVFLRELPDHSAGVPRPDAVLQNSDGELFPLCTEALGILHQLVVFVQYPFAVPEHVLPGRSQLRIHLVPLNQLNADFFFHALNHSTEGGLGHIQLLCRLGKIQGFG